MNYCSSEDACVNYSDLFLTVGGYFTNNLVDLADWENIDFLVWGVYNNYNLVCSFEVVAVFALLLYSSDFVY